MEAPLESIPDSVLLHSVLPLLDRDSLARLSCCNRRLSIVSTSDNLWFPIFVLEWGLREPFTSPPSPWPSWHRMFCYKQNRRCIECQEHTSYVHTLSSSRFPLCERCEHACQKYSLVTKMEAKQRYLLTDEDLQPLRFKKVGMKRFSVYFFLKSEVESIATRNSLHNVQPRTMGEEQQTKNVRFDSFNTSCHRGNKHDDVHYGESSSKDISYGVSKMQVRYEESHTQETVPHEDVSHVNFKDVDAEKAHKKEIRKEHKRLVKSIKREQRLIKSSNITSGAHSSAISSSNSINVSSLCSNVIQAKMKKKWRTKREHTITMGSNQSPDFAEGKSKARSDWIREREWLEIELGPYGISALELAPDS